MQKEDIILRENIKKIRTLFETKINKISIYDQKNEESKFKKQFDDLSVYITFVDLEVYDNLIFWGGTIDGIIEFTYTITTNENTSGVEYNYLTNFNPENEKNDEIIKRIDSYYNIFYKYWINELTEK